MWPPSADEDARRIDEAVALARRLVDDAAALDATAPRRRRRHRARLRTIVRDPGAAEFTVQLTDEIPRLRDPRRAADRFARLVATADLSAFSVVDRSALRAGAMFAPLLPRVVMPLVARRLRAESSDVVLPADDAGLTRYLATRRRAGMRPNVNVLGEAIVGHDEARARLETVIARLRRPDVDYVSVKISAICAGISTLAFEDTVDRISDRLRVVYGAAAACEPPVFVNLDMEEYRDLDITVAAFRRVLDEAPFMLLDAGIVLQAYLPDAYAVARDLGEWAMDRRRRGGGRTQVRLVKGANLAMETVEAELRGWEPAPFGSKNDVDANYKAMLDVLSDPLFDDAVDIGVGSHNLFDIAWALGVRERMIAAGRRDRLGIEMLEGMAPSQSEAVLAVAGELVLYAPIVQRGDFPSALAYLVRRLDENTAPANFLSQLFDIAADPTRFEHQADLFRAAVRRRHQLDHRPRRQQARPTLPQPSAERAFANVADTDWTRPANRAWIAEALQTLPPPPLLAEVTADDVDVAVGIARDAQVRWWNLGADRRARLLHAVADRFEVDRGRILATMAHEAGKTVLEGDPEVSEAIDFARYYAEDGRRLAGIDGAHSAALGTVLVASPWNFPFAIPAGGVLAALAAGSVVILKPAPQSVRTAALIVELCVGAGVPPDVVQLVPAPDGEVGRRLVTHPLVDAVVLTGSQATASMFLEWQPALRLHGETSGKNAMVISATSDIDHAVADVVRSAFGHAGQKCSAASLAIVEAPLYDDPAFLERLRDAAATLRIGPATELATDVGPLIEPPGPALTRALTSLDPGESWLLEPVCRSEDRRTWTTGIRIGVRPGSWFARTECFGPVLGVIRADDLDHAIAIQNDSEFGLTAGLQALDPAEVEHWLERVEAGNVYVNRGTTGAVVRRQPFGGWKQSSVGPTAKAGGPNYVTTLMRWSDDGSVAIEDVVERFERWMAEVGRAERDVSNLRSEHNRFRYRTGRGVAVRFGPLATGRERQLIDAAARVTGTCMLVSDTRDQGDGAFAASLTGLVADRLRLIGAADDAVEIRRACHAAGVAVDDGPPVCVPEIELPRWLREQAVCITAHRHGRLAETRHRIP
jgi:RHH-type transcriptional regulator, proline utilization regulon repressor / proline dehydrogenase / delta 1-pyrroline-5-carboxylate dehydrogenase